MGVKIDLTQIETFGEGIRAFRIVPAAEAADTDASSTDVPAIKIPDTTGLARMLRERQQRARRDRRE